jgi:hypothetical protein
MNINEKQKLVTVTIIVASFLFGIAVNNAITDRSISSTHPAYSQASIWSRLFGNVQQEEISDYADVIRLVLDQVEKIHDLETRIAVLETCGSECKHNFPPPDYDSGWVDIGLNYDYPFHHNLDTMDYLVYIMNNDEEVRDQFHNYAAGGEAFVRNGELLDMGTHWKATKNTLYVYRSIDDSRAYLASDYVRVLLWKIPT